MNLKNNISFHAYQGDLSTLCFKLPIILSGNFFTYYSQNYFKYSWSNSWNCMDILLQLKV